MVVLLPIFIAHAGFDGSQRRLVRRWWHVSVLIGRMRAVRIAMVVLRLRGILMPGLATVCS